MHEQAEGGDAAHWRYKATPDWSGAGAFRRSFDGLSRVLGIGDTGARRPRS